MIRSGYMRLFIPRSRASDAQQHSYGWLVVGICGLCGIGWLINTLDPDYLLSLVLFFPLLLITLVSVMYFITNIVRRSLLIGGGVFVFFFLRFLGLRDWFYVVPLVVFLVFIELSYQNR
jgi:hypothetical protein